MSWTCEQTEAQLSDYLDGLISPDRAPRIRYARERVRKLRADRRRASPSRERPAQDGANRTARRFSPIDSESNSWPAPNQEGLARCFRLAGRFGFAAIRLQRCLGRRFARNSGIRVGNIAAQAEARRPFSVNIYRGVDRQAHLVYARSTKFVSDLARRLRNSISFEQG